MGRAEQKNKSGPHPYRKHVVGRHAQYIFYWWFWYKGNVEVLSFMHFLSLAQIRILHVHNTMGDSRRVVQYQTQITSEMLKSRPTKNFSHRCRSKLGIERLLLISDLKTFWAI